MSRTAIEIALATGTPPAAWLSASDVELATALDVLDQWRRERES